MDGLELLKNDHDEVRRLFSEFRQLSESGDRKRIEALARQIFQELEIHSAIEEELLYPATEEMGGLEDITHESVEEHHVVDVLIREIEELSPDDDAFTAKMTVLMENVEHHAQEEEEEMFPKVRDMLSQDRLQKLGEELEQAKKRHKADRVSRDELYAKAQEAGVKGRSNMSKEELAEAVERATES